MTTPNAELDGVLEPVEAAGLVEQYTNDAGKAAMRLTPKGAQLGRATAMAGDDADTKAMLDALLDDAR